MKNLRNILQKLNPFKRKNSIPIGRKPNYQELNSDAKRVLAKDMEESKRNYERELEAKKKKGDAIPIFDPQNPDPELIAFAKVFSYSYKVFTASTEGVKYVSNKGTYEIKYFEKLMNAIGLGLELTTPARVGNISGIIEFSKKVLLSSEKITSDWIFFLVIWSVIRKQVSKERTYDYDLELNDDMITDEIAVKYYLTTKRSVKNLHFGFIEMMRNSSNQEHNNKRYKKLKELTSHLEKT